MMGCKYVGLHSVEYSNHLIIGGKSVEERGLKFTPKR
jgi:hypothetical protein